MKIKYIGESGGTLKGSFRFGEIYDVALVVSDEWVIAFDDYNEAADLFHTNFEFVKGE